ncbi:hypothetical protein LEP1GSC186_4728 [Leptospira noguchii serovar Autumnalis str. ZUN142]|uniref:Uncharacterized protein n=1 Tax=Leptospira noguchii serovar Autumnalis str. ZUN142 TaxID=1085540 RepID=M6U7R3_9LEPT|nr:hypothetical protein LEP1GSC186_4728 [Leptospira noguchii serovar Autumnalis str. ZUN142]
MDFFDNLIVQKFINYSRNVIYEKNYFFGWARLKFHVHDFF